MADSIEQVSESSDDSGLLIKTETIDSDDCHSPSEKSDSINISMCDSDSKNTTTVINCDQNAISESVVENEVFSGTSLNNDRLLLDTISSNSGDNHALSKISNDSLVVNTSTTHCEQDSVTQCIMNSEVLTDNSHNNDGLLLKTRTSHNHDGLLIETISLSSDDNHTLSEISNLNSNLTENLSTVHHEQDSDTGVQDEVSHVANDTIGLQISTNAINSDSNHTLHKISNLNSNLLSNNKTENKLTPNFKRDLVNKLKVEESSKFKENYDIGDIVWAKIGKYPFWPSVVCFDPKSNIYYKGSKNKKNFLLHVRFCNDKGRRSWIKTLENYNGKNELLSKYPNCLSCIKSSKKLLDTWNLAVEEADHLLNLVGELRMLEFFKTFLSSEDLACLNPTALNISSESSGAATKVRTYSRKRSLTIPEQDSYTKIIKTENHLCMNGNSSSRSIDIPFPSRSDDADSTVSDISMNHVYMEDLGTKMKQSIIDKRKSTKKYPPKTSFTDKYDLSDSMETSLVYNNDRSLLLDNRENYTSTAMAASTSRTIPKQRKLEIRNLENFEKDNSHSHRTSKKNSTSKSLKPVISSNNDDLSSNSTSHSQSASSSQKTGAKLKPQRKESFTAKKTTTKTTIKSESSPEPDTTESEASSKNETYTSIFSTSRKNKQLFVKSLKRACVVCKNIEETIKCMGPCQSYFHKECLAKSEERYFKSEPKIKKVKKSSGRSKRYSSKSTHKNVDASASVPQIVNDFKEENTGILYENENFVSTGIKSEFKEECLNETIEENESHDQPKSDDVSENSHCILPEKVNTQELNELESVVRDSIQEMEDKHFDPATETTLNSSSTPESDSKYMCSLCKAGKAKCFVCTLDIEDPGQKIVCKLSTCGKNYHEYCLAEWPQCQWIQRSRNNVRCVVCPHHVCHLCISDNPKSSCKMHFPAEKLTRCIKCPTAYHRSEYCIPAGSQILTYWDIICSRHFEPSKDRNYHFNATWCFICTLGGDLVCCDLCPSSFHIKCLNQNPSEFDRGFTCEECQTGRYPLYGEIVWVKLGNYRWWPAQIVFPGQIPESINSIAHSVGEFAVRFFGSYDYYWVNRGRVFNFHEGDDENILIKNNKMKVIDQLFQDAIIEAAQAHNAYVIDKDKNDAIVAKKYLAKPPKFTRIKFNKPYGNVKNMEFDMTTINPCECDPFKPNPCGPGSDCINRMLMFECHPQVCPAADKCNNQRFEKTLYPAMVPFLTQGRGWGLKTLEDIKEGSFVIEYVGEVIDEEEFQRRCLEMHQRNEQNYYFLTIDNSRMIDAGPKGNLSRFMNHSCEPNCVTQKWTVNGNTRIGLFALCDIPTGTELVFDYRLQSCSGVEKKPCQCGASRCSKFIGVKVEEEKKKVIPINDTEKNKTTTKNKRKPLKHKDNVSDSDKSKLSKVTNDNQNISITENPVDTCIAEKNDDSKKPKNKVSTGKPSTVIKNENLESSETIGKNKRKKSNKNYSSMTKDDVTTVNCLETDETKSKKKIKNSSSALPLRKQSIKNNVIQTVSLPLLNDSTGIPEAKLSKNRDHVVDLENMISTISRKSTRGLTQTKQIPEVLKSASEIKTDKSAGYQERSTARNSLSRLAKTRHSFLSKMNKNDTGKKKIEQPQSVVSKKRCNKEKMNTTKTKSKRTEIPLVKTVVSKKNKSSQPKQTNKRQKLNQNLKSKSYKKNESCLICGKGYAELICKNKKCPRVFHLSCMNRTRVVKSGFICPSHFCSVCKKRKVVAKCKFCVESFCTTHVKGNIFKDPLGHGMLCTTHHPNKKSVPVASTSTSGPIVTVKENVTTNKITDPVNLGGSNIEVEMPETVADINEELGIDIDDINEEEYTLTQVIKDDCDREYIHIGGFNVCNMSDLVTDQSESYTVPIDTDGDLFKPSSANVVIDIESASALYQSTDSLQLVSIATENKESHVCANVNFIPDSNQTKSKWLAAEP